MTARKSEARLVCRVWKEGKRRKQEGPSLWAGMRNLVDVTWAAVLISLTISIILVCVWGEAGLQTHMTVVWMSEENFQEWVLLPNGFWVSNSGPKAGKPLYPLSPLISSFPGGNSACGQGKLKKVLCTALRGPEEPTVQLRRSASPCRNSHWSGVISAMEGYGHHSQVKVSESGKLLDLRIRCICWLLSVRMGLWTCTGQHALQPLDGLGASFKLADLFFFGVRA